jgi:hypothetical protein
MANFLKRILRPELISLNLSVDRVLSIPPRRAVDTDEGWRRSDTGEGNIRFAMCSAQTNRSPRRVAEGYEALETLRQRRPGPRSI